MGEHFFSMFTVLVLEFVFSIIILFNTSSIECDHSKLAGHLKKLGSHRKPQNITWTETFSSPDVFYHHFVEPGTPVLMRGVLEQVNHPGLINWTDTFLSMRYGSELVKVEKSKIENRDFASSLMKIKDFLSIYQSEDVYMVHSLASKMKDLVLIPSTLQCGGFQKVIQDAVLWMGSLHASSVLHRDPLDNLLCLLNGRKEVVLIDKAYKDQMESDGFDRARGFSKVNPQQVDFKKFPFLSEAMWHEAPLEKGDCLFIPQGWYHQVTSSGFRHVSINLWFSHLWSFNSSDCKHDVGHYKQLEPISTFGFASSNEAHRSALLSNFKNQDRITRNNFHEFLPNKPTKERANEFFNTLNKLQDAVLSWDELYSFDIDKILMQYPDLFLPETVRNNMDDDSPDDNGVDDDTVDIKDDSNEESNKPLPDAVSNESPSLPDSSFESYFDASLPHHNVLNQQGVNRNFENSDSGESVLQEEDVVKTSKMFYDFVEASNSIPNEADSYSDQQIDIKENVTQVNSHIPEGARNEL